MELFVFIISFLYFFTVINITSLYLNIRYTIYFIFNDLLGKIKSQLDLYTTEVYNVESLIVTLKKIIPDYHYDPFHGVLNWLSWVKVTLGRTLYLPHEKHSKDCYEHARVLKYLIDESVISKKPFYHNGIEKKYSKSEILLLFSMKPLIKMNHAILIAFWNDENKKTYIDIFTPYQYLKTIEKFELKNIYKIIETAFNNRVKYNKYWITLRI